MADNLESLENQLEIFIENIRQVSKLKLQTSGSILLRFTQFPNFFRLELLWVISSSKDNWTRRFKT